MAKRLRIGKLPDGSYGVLCSLPGVNVETADPNNLDQIAFNSSWTDIVKVAQFGIAGLPQSPSVGMIPFAYPGYIPFWDTRMYSNPNFFNNWGVQLYQGPGTNGPYMGNGIFSWISVNNPGTLKAWVHPSSPTNVMFYVVYKAGWANP